MSRDLLGVILLCILFCLPSVSFAGFLQDSTCYATEQEAMDAEYSGFVSTVHPQVGSTSIYYDLNYSVSTGLWSIRKHLLDDVQQVRTLVSAIPLPVVHFAGCDVSTSVTAAGIQNSFEFGFFVVAGLASFGLVLGFALMAIKKL